jgi:Flp pilus assembly pilin Flp
MKKKLTEFIFRTTQGQGMVEYSLIIFLIAIGLVTAIGLMGVSIKDFFQDASVQMNKL